MKVRNGFVSNSSSSSFLLATRGEVTKEKLLGLFGVSKDSFLYSFAEEVAGFFAGVRTDERYTTVEELRKRYAWDDEEQFKNERAREISLIEDGWTLYIGSASDEASEGVEVWICHEQITFESVDLILETEGGY